MELCVSLDLPSKEENLKLVRTISKESLWLKVGLRSYIRDGKEFLSEIKNISPKSKIFLDLKLYDIPNTMADAACEIASLGVDMFNVHASAGKIAMQTVMQRLSEVKQKPIVLAVTALTSFSHENFKETYNASLEQTAIKFAKDAYDSGLHGVVCSVFESLSIKQACNENFYTLTPGIRLDNNSSDDQERISNIQNAYKNKSDFIVVGRPIYNSKDPKGVVEEILSQITGLQASI